MTTDFEGQRASPARSRGSQRGARASMRGAAGGGAAVPFRERMAVPKQKQSHSRTAKRRAQHKMASPVYNACPTCHEPRRPHRVCANCGSYKGSEVVAPSAHDHDHDH
jgi:large subunit ribosomal protein L32